MLETWKKAAMLITGTFGDVVSEEYNQHARKLLSEELSRQGYTVNAKSAMLRNFDCYKAKTNNSDNVIDNFSARAACLSIPITGVDTVMKTFSNFRLNSRTTTELAKRNETAITIRQRSINVHQMHSELQSLISDTQDANDTTRTHLINLHQVLLGTNERLETRIPPMQDNCMK